MRDNEAPNAIAIILNWNGSDDTLSCIRSLRDITYPNFGVIVVDNGSTDDSVQQITAGAPDVEVLRNPSNLGFSGGNNIGIKAALQRGADFVWLLNSDVRVDASALEQLVRVASSDPSIGAVGSVIYDMEEPSNVQAWGGAHVTRLTGRAVRHTQKAEASRIHYLIGASVLIRSSALRAIGLLDEDYFMYWDDADLGFRLRKAGWRLALADRAKVWHKEAGSLGKGSPEIDAMFSHSAVLFYRRHFSVPLVPIVLNVMARSIRRMARGDWQRLGAVWRGTLLGLRGKPPGKDRADSQSN